MTLSPVPISIDTPLFNITSIQPSISGPLHGLTLQSPSYKFIVIASIRHHSPKLVRTIARTGQPTRLPAADRHHRNPTSARFSGGRPHCVVPGQGGCDWTEVSLWAIRGHGDSICYGLILSQVVTAFALILDYHFHRLSYYRQSPRTALVASAPHDRIANVTGWLDIQFSRSDVGQNLPPHY